MFLYHSFPRKGDYSYGLQVVESILTIGLLITPEDRKIPGIRNLRDCDLIQQRVCFTALLPNELKEHSKDFGEFSFEFNPTGLRDFGVLPAFYITSPLPGGEMMHVGGIQTLRLISEAYLLMEALFQHRDKGQPCERDFVNKIFKPKRPGTNDVEIQEVKYGLEAILNLYYPTENLKYNAELGYYRQREWKIVPNFAIHHEWIYPDLEDPDKAKLLALNNDYFGAPLRDGTLRVDKCKRFKEVAGRSILNTINRLVVPDDNAVLAEAQKLVSANGFTFPVVKLSDLK